MGERDRKRRQSKWQVGRPFRYVSAYRASTSKEAARAQVNGRGRSE